MYIYMCVCIHDTTGHRNEISQCQVSKRPSPLAWFAALALPLCFVVQKPNQTWASQSTQSIGLQWDLKIQLMDKSCNLWYWHPWNCSVSIISSDTKSNIASSSLQNLQNACESTSKRLRLILRASGHQEKNTQDIMSPLRLGRSEHPRNPNKGTKLAKTSQIPWVVPLPIDSDHQEYYTFYHFW